MNVKYFDGKSSKAYSVTIQKMDGGIKIESAPDSEGTIQRFWREEDITTESFSVGDKILLSYGNFPHERLQIKGAAADKFAFNIRKNESLLKQIYHFLTRANPFKLVLGSILLLGIVIYGYVMHISPFVGEQAVRILPQSVEKKAGEVMYRNLSQTMDIDTVKSKKLVEFFEACGFKSEYDIRIDYAANDMVNAFAVPGGQIVVFEGLIAETKSWDELAALMGHELAHVNQRHSFKQIARSISSYFLIAVLTGDVGGISSVVLENASQIYNYSNSRSHEQEADEVGLMYLKDRKIRPEAMVDLFRRLQGEEVSSSEVVDSLGGVALVDIEKTMEYLQTHPSTGNRIKNIQGHIDNDSSFDYNPQQYDHAKAIWQELKNSVGKDSYERKGVIESVIEKIGIEDDEEEEANYEY